MAAHTSLALRGSQGIWTVEGPPHCVPANDFPGDNCKVMCFSPDGSLFAFCDAISVKVLSTSDYRLVLQIDKPRTLFIQFSPRNNLVATWEQYVVTQDNPHGSPNLNIWEVKSGTHVRGLFQKKHADWAPQWSFDEEICGRNVNNELQFYEKNNFESPVQKLHLQKVAQMRLTHKTVGQHHVAAYVPGSKGQPSYVRIYRYPNFGGPQAALANKSFYQADKVDLIWNNKGTGLLLLTASDTSKDSYYGDQGLHYVTTSGESCLVPRQKNGPVYSVEWSPKSQEFTVVYGFMPAKATLYNLKCEPIFDFGTGPRNIVYYNPHGNVLCLAGFGNLGGNMEFWDVNGRRLIGKTEARDSTFFQWCSDSKHIVTATTSPRLRVGNGFKFWDWTGQLLYEESVQSAKELYDVAWQPAPDGKYPEPRLPGGLGITAAQQEAAKPAAYVPPGMRDRPRGTVTAGKYRAEYEPASNAKQAPQGQENMSKAAIKNRKKKEAKARAREAQAGTVAEPDSEPFVPHEPEKPKMPQQAASQPHPSSGATAGGDPEKNKKIKNLNKKLRQIQQLKEQKASGKELEVNQIEKLKSEASLVQELKQLQLSS